MVAPVERPAVAGTPGTVTLGAVMSLGVPVAGGWLREYFQFSMASTIGPPPWSRNHSTVRTAKLAFPGYSNARTYDTAGTTSNRQQTNAIQRFRTRRRRRRCAFCFMASVDPRSA